ncbi:MAG TPA: VOC family protein [Gemmatimonadales bacterium]|nr:VOC family protein [Gemmatimonadales bacterium]
MRIKLTSLIVDDQDRALRFYTEVLGFRKKHDIPVGEFRWITVTSPEGRDDLELVLEPNANPAGKAFQEAMFSQGIPLAAFEVADIAREYARLDAAGVAFTRKPTPTGPVVLAVMADTCGNLIQLYQPTE